MSKWIISKQFDFCYGHRVWSQTLNKEYSIDDRCVCRHLHGHQGTILIHLEGGTLKNGMVTDFKHLNWFKQFLDKTLDHKFIIDTNDPLFWNIVPPYEGCEIPLKAFKEGYKTVDPNFFKTIKREELIDLYEGFVIVDFVPTSENLSNWIYKIVSEKMNKINIAVSSINFFETPKSQSTYIG